jgi:ABC-type multidrug transport system ATPase subunit
MDEVEHCDRIILMSRGRIAAFDTPEGLKKSTLEARLKAGQSYRKEPTLEDVFIDVISRMER